MWKYRWIAIRRAAEVLRRSLETTLSIDAPRQSRAARRHGRRKKKLLVGESARARGWVAMRDPLLKGAVLACERPTHGFAGPAVDWLREAVRA
jgi:hypothetical protein